MKNLNWRLWVGLLLSVVAFISYFNFFARFPVTRDIPWLNVLLFFAAMVLLIQGFRSARRRVMAGIVGAIGAGIFVFFIAVIILGATVLPSAASAPRVGQRVPDFTLLDTHRNPTSLQQILSSTPHGALLIFYRGYW